MIIVARNLYRQYGPMTNMLPLKQVLAATLIRWLKRVSTSEDRRRNKIPDVLSTLDNDRLKDIGLERRREGYLAIHAPDADQGTQSRTCATSSVWTGHSRLASEHMQKARRRLS